VVVALLAAVAPSALASPAAPAGVHVDPNSPAGKQYQIPIGAARSETSSGRPASGSNAAQNPPAFGAGITPASTPSATTPVGPTSSSTEAEAAARAKAAARVKAAARARTRSRQRLRRRKGSRLAVARPPAVSSAGTAGDSGALALLGGGALVLVLGGGVGLALRGRS
jgi:hypothetical protein